MDVTISIVSFNTKDLVKKCVQSIAKHTKGISFEIVVVDNGSKDDTALAIRNLASGIKNLKIISNSKNLFFSAANNQALKIAKGRYFLVLNSDTYFVDNSIKTLVDFMDKNRKIGACEGLELDEKGKAVPTGSRFSFPFIDFLELSFISRIIRRMFLFLGTSKILHTYRMKNFDRKKDFEIDVGCDAFLLARTSLLRKIGGYDQKLLLYYTENDLCKRIKDIGYKIMHKGNAKVIHKVSASVSKLGFEKMDIYYLDLFYYYRKHGYFISGLLLFLLLKCEEFFLKIIKG